MTDQQPLVEILRLENGAGLELPSYQSKLAAGADLRAALAEDAPVTLRPGARRLIPAGFAIALPPGFEAQVRPRSGLSVKYGISIVNAPGTVDADYRGEVMVNLINLGQEDFTIRRGDRIAQMVIARAPQAIFEEVRSLSETPRGPGGFGSTGV